MRRSNYDLLRVLACFLVVLGHVSGTFIETMVWDLIDGLPLNHPLFSMIYTALARVSVPAFLMLSGAFLLNDERTGDVKTFYRRSFWKIGPPAAGCVVFTLFYNLITRSGMDHLGLRAALEPFLYGAPFYHLWYLPILFGLYLLAPFIHGAKMKLTRGGFVKAAVFMVVFGNLSMYMTGPIQFHWNIGEVFCYAGYFMMGAVLYTEKPNPRAGAVEILAGILIECFAGYIAYRAILGGMEREMAEHWFILSYTPFTTAASLLFFSGFGKIQVRRSWHRLASHSYSIYLVHAFVLDIIIRLCRTLLGQRWLTHLDARFFVPLITMGVFLISLCVSVLLKRADNKKKLKAA